MLYGHTKIDLKVNVNRMSLLDKLRTNLTRHTSENEVAVSEYRESLIQHCKDNLVKAQEGEKLNREEPPQPKDYSDEYKRAISMLEVATSEEVILSAEDYAKFYMDKWEWSNQWETTNSLYTDRRNRGR